jgi:DNA-binding response OmpR family regulator
VSQRLLLIEDEENIAFALRYNLEDEGYSVVHVDCLARADEELRGGSYDVIILDRMLPDGDGADFCNAMRVRGDHTPVLMLTAKNASSDVIGGLDAGADDYLGKPFELGELLGRLAAMLRRAGWAPPSKVPANEPTLVFGTHRIEFDERRMFANGVEIAATDLELRLLRFFGNNANSIVSREKLLEEVWGVSGKMHTRTVDNFIVRLRKAFEEDASDPKHFVTVRGVGYRFVP